MAERQRRQVQKAESARGGSRRVQEPRQCSEQKTSLCMRDAVRRAESRGERCGAGFGWGFAGRRVAEAITAGGTDHRV